MVVSMLQEKPVKKLPSAYTHLQKIVSYGACVLVGY